MWKDAVLPDWIAELTGRSVTSVVGLARTRKWGVHGDPTYVKESFERKALKAKGAKRAKRVRSKVLIISHAKGAYADEGINSKEVTPKEVTPKSEGRVYEKVLLINARSDQCRYPLVNNSPWFVCGQKTVPPTPYCSDHCKVSYNKSTYPK
jgi:hypothetical protein